MAVHEGERQPSRTRILVCDPIHADGVDLLRNYAQVDIVEGAGLTRAGLEELIGHYHAVVVDSRTDLPASVIQRAEKLQIIARSGAGLDNVDVAAARQQAIEVINSPDANTIAVAEHTLALMLALARNLVAADLGVKSGRWDWAVLTGVGLAGKTLGIIGFGRIGRQVAQRARAFDMRIVVNQNRLTPELALTLGVEQLDLPDLLRQADFVTLHVPPRPSNVGMLHAGNLAWMKPTAYLINTSLGDTVDEAALLDALDQGRLAGAGLDMFGSGTDCGAALVRHPKVLATPHIGARTVDAQRKAAITVCERIVSVLRRQHVAQSLSLEVVPLEQVAPHEETHGRRVSNLVDRLVTDRRLVNPPIAARLNGKYIILDGATRVTAFRQLSYPHIILQVVDIQKQRVQLHTWYHVVRGGSVTNLLNLLRGVPGLRLAPLQDDAGCVPQLEQGALGCLITAAGQKFSLETASVEALDGADWMDVLNEMVRRYGEWGNVDRTLSTDIDQLGAQYPDLAGVFIFPQFSPQMILEMAAQGRTVPAGITRFVIPGRILRLNAPIDKLADQEPLARKRQWLDEFVREKLAYRQVRYYEEPVVLLDE